MNSPTGNYLGDLKIELQQGDYIRTFIIRQLTTKLNSFGKSELSCYSRSGLSQGNL
jgi:hypothetical protein